MDTAKNLAIQNETEYRTLGRTSDVLVTMPSRQIIWFRSVVFKSRGLTTLLPKAPVNPM